MSTWTIEPNGGAFNVLDADGDLVCMYADEDQARLIACAPELFSLAKEAQQYIAGIAQALRDGRSSDVSAVLNELGERMRAALSKAGAV